LAQTAAIEVCLPFNFAVVFDFTYFRFRPSKAKSIGDVLTKKAQRGKLLSPQRVKEFC
jgi:hypothetical protein